MSPAQSNGKISRSRACREDAAYVGRQDCYTERSDTGVKGRGNLIGKSTSKVHLITGQESPEVGVEVKPYSLFNLGGSWGG
jgi:hypothetical protein